MTQVELYKLISNTGSNIELNTITIPTNGILVYLNPIIIKENHHNLIDLIFNGSIGAISVDDINPLTPEKTITDIEYIYNKAIDLDFSKKYNQVSWNITMAPQLVSIVRGEMLDSPLVEMGLSGPILLSKLANIIGATQVGMFREAWQMFYVLEPDAFHTPERISRYISLLQSSDAIIY